MVTSSSLSSGRVIVLVELGLVELRYQAVLEVLQQGATVTEVAVRFGVTSIGVVVQEMEKSFADLQPALAVKQVSPG